MLVAFVMSIWRAREARTAATYGSARWATASEVRTAQLMGPDGVVLGRFGRHYFGMMDQSMYFALRRRGLARALVSSFRPF